MSDDNRDDLISAYFDDELSLDERARVEELLHASDAARRELEEVRCLSRVLKGFTAEPAPEDLSAAVLAQAERDSLLASVPERAQRGWLAPVIGLLVTAASLLLLAQGFHSDQEGADVAARLASTGDAAPQAVVQSESEEAADAPLAAPESESTPTESLAKRRRDAAPKSPVAMKAFAAPADGKTDPLSPNTIGTERQIDLNHDQLRNAKIGDVIRHFDTKDENVSVVELIVLDVQKALGTIHIVLDRHNVADPSTNETASKTPAPEEPVVGDGPIIVYVEATPQQLTRALQDLQQDGQYVGLKLQRSIRLAATSADETDSSLARKLSRLDDPLSRGVELAETAPVVADEAPPASRGAAKALRSKKQRESLTAKTAGKSATVLKKDDARVAPPAPATAKKKAPTLGNPGSGAKVARRSIQAPTPLQSETNAKRADDADKRTNRAYRLTLPLDKALAANEADRAVLAEQLDSERLLSAASGTRSLRVLFVLRAREEP